MNYDYWLHEKIQADINEGFEWYEDKLQGLGYEFLAAIENKIAEIVAHPERFASKTNPNFREALLVRFNSPGLILSDNEIIFVIGPQRGQMFIVNSSLPHTTP